MRREMTWIVVFAVMTAFVLPSDALARRYGGGGGSRGGGGFRSFGSSRSFSRPSAPRYDERARRSIGQESSRQRFSRYGGPGAPKVTPQQMSTRDGRERAVTASRQPTGYFTPRPGPVVVYRDPFSSSMLQYMSMMWLFHHWDQVDRRRFDEARVRDLERQVAEMKAKGMQPDPSYVEPGVDPDLVYRKDALEQPGGSHWGLWFLGFLVACGAGFALLCVFVKRSRKENGRPREGDRPREEDGLYNPLGLHNGDFVSFKALDLSGRNWSVTQVSEYQRVAGAETFPMITYDLQDADRRILLRAVPGAEETSPPDLLALKVFDEMGFNEEVAEAVKSNEFYVDEDDGTRITYYALSDCGEEGWFVRTKTVTDSLRPAQEGEIRYWDYYRKGDVSRGEMAGEIFFFVEVDQATGWTRMLEGSRITSGDVETYSA